MTYSMVRCSRRRNGLRLWLCLPMRPSSAEEDLIRESRERVRAGPATFRAQAMPELSAGSSSSERNTRSPFHPWSRRLSHSNRGLGPYPA